MVDQSGELKTLFVSLYKIQQNNLYFKNKKRQTNKGGNKSGQLYIR